MATSELLFDYYLLGTVKNKCYANKPQATDALKNNIREAIGEIQLHTIDNMVYNWNDRVSYCMASRSSHLNEISNKTKEFEKIFCNFF